MSSDSDCNSTRASMSGKANLLCAFCTLLAAAIFYLLFQHCAAYADPDSVAYKKAMKAFNSGDYKTSQTLFDGVLRGDGSDSSAMYMEALSYQRLGQNDRARMLYRNCCSSFPYSGACERAQQALRTMDPVFLKTFLKNRPAPVQTAPLGDPSMVTAVAPQWGWSTRPLTQDEQRERKTRVYNGGVFKAKVGGAMMDCYYDKNAKRSYVGFNQLAAVGLKPRGKVGSIMQMDVDLDMSVTRQFPFLTKKYLPGPVQLGQDFKDAWDYTIAISNPLTAGRFVSREKKALLAQQHAKEFEGKADGVRMNTTDDGKDDILAKDPNDNTDPKVKTFDVPYRPLYDITNAQTQKREIPKIVTAYVDGGGVEMLFQAAGITTFSVQDMLNINPSYVPAEFKQETTVPGYQIKSSAEIVLRQLRLGKLDRYHVPAILEAYSSVRYQSPSGGTAIPLLGQDFTSGWNWVSDDQRRIITFHRLR